MDKKTRDLTRNTHNSIYKTKTAALSKGIAAVFYSTQICIALAFTRNADKLFIVAISIHRVRCRSPPTPLFEQSKTYQMEENKMTRINLRDLYPFYKGDCFIEVSDDVLTEIRKYERREEAYRRYLRYYNVLSLDCADQQKLEHELTDKSMIPEDAYDHKVMSSLLYLAIGQLPKSQANRIFVHFFHGMSCVEIAQAEGVDESAVRASIKRGLQKMRKILISFFQ